MSRPAAEVLPGATSFKRILTWAGILLLGFLLLSAIAALLADRGAVLAALAHVDVERLLILFALASVAFVLRTLRWQLYSRAQGLAIPLRDNALVYLGGFALGATPGRLGEIVRLWLLRRGFGFPYRRTAPLLVADRLNDVNTLALLMLLGSSQMLQQRSLISVALLLVIALNLTLRFPGPLLRVIGLLHVASARRLPRVAGGLRRLLRRIAGTFDLRTQFVASLLSLAAWSAECTSLYLIVGALGNTAVTLDLASAFAIHATASLIGALSLLPGGIGGFEATCLALLIWQGVPAPTAVAATALLRITTFWYSLALGVPALAWAAARMQKRADAATDDRFA